MVLLTFAPRGDKPPRYMYKARSSGLGGFSRLRNHRRGVHPTAGQQRRRIQLKQENAITKNNLAENLSRPLGIHLAIASRGGEPPRYIYKVRSSGLGG